MSMDSGRKDACTFPLKMGKTLVTGSSTWRRWHLWGKSQSPPSVSLHEHSVSKSKEHHCTYDFACDEGSVHGLTHLSQAPTYNVHGRKEDTTIFRRRLLHLSSPFCRRCFPYFRETHRLLPSCHRTWTRQSRLAKPRRWKTHIHFWIILSPTPWSTCHPFGKSLIRTRQKEHGRWETA